MSYETSYNTGLKPFNHDRNRGKWSSPMDFFFTCIGHALKVDALFVMPSVIFRELGICALIPYFIVLVTCVIPIILIQSFLGQFSSTGFISVFRIAPLFKGIGWISLAVNVLSFAYFSLFGAIPLLYLFHSLQPILPWSCEGAKQWFQVTGNATTTCHPENGTFNGMIPMEVPSLQFFIRKLKTNVYHKSEHPEGTFSWELLICNFLIWIMVAGVLSQSLQWLAKFLRYSWLTVIGIMCLCIVRFAFLPGAIDGLSIFIEPTGKGFIDSWIVMPLAALSALGSGWGSILTMASYNKFKTNIFRYSWIICLAQFGVMFGLGLMTIFIWSFLQRANEKNIHFMVLHSQWLEFLVTPTALTFLEVPHFWTVIYLLLIILGSLNLLIVQLFSVLTSLFDEWESLRSVKKEVTFGAVGVLALISIGVSWNYGISLSELLTKSSIMTQMILNLLLLLVVLWVYGRERFQRDLTFMTSRTYSTWMVNIARFVAPIFLLFSLLVGLFLMFAFDDGTGFVAAAFVVTGTALIWCAIPGYCIFKIVQTTRMLGMRFRRCVRPTDWYPAEPLDRQRYEETFSNLGISHQLTTTTLEQGVY